MIYLFYGSDVEKVRSRAFAWVAAARAKEPNLAYVRLTKEELTPASLEDVTLSEGLFVKRLLVLLDDPFATARRSEEDEEEGESESTSMVEDHVDALVKSDNAIVVLAPKLAAIKAKKIVAKATKAYEFNESAGLPAGRQGFNSGLVNALAAKNREKLWLEVIRALRAGDPPEMLHGLLHWKARDLMSRGSKDGRALSLALLKLLQDSRRSGLNLGLSLEKFSLSI